MKPHVLCALALLAAGTTACATHPTEALESPAEGLQLRLQAPRSIGDPSVSFPFWLEVRNPHGSRALTIDSLRLRHGSTDISLPVNLIVPCSNQERPVRAPDAVATQREAAQMRAIKSGVQRIQLTFTEAMGRQVEAEGACDLVFEALDAQGAVLGRTRWTFEGSTPALRTAKGPLPARLGPNDASTLEPLALQASGMWLRGDTHVHSNLSAEECWYDGIATPEQLQSIARAAGMHWFVLTDHNYSVDRTTWNTWRSRVLTDPIFNSGTFCILMGQEISARENYAGNYAPYDTCHINGVGHSTHISGSYDWCTKKANSPDAKDVLSLVRSYGGFSVINHPCEGTQSTDAWDFNVKSYAVTTGEDGMELINMEYDGALGNGVGSASNWIARRLLKGQKVFPIAGSDTENNMHLGECSTWVYADRWDRTSILAGLKRGMLYATTGPHLIYWAQDDATGTWYDMGQKSATLNGGQDGWAWISAYVEDNRNDAMEYTILVGKAGLTAEKVAVRGRIQAGGDPNVGHWVWVPKGSYIRMETVSVTSPGWKAFAAPIWFR